MIILKRLNLDSSWHINFDGVGFVIDPWLFGSEVDGFKWLNQQWHIKEPVNVREIPSYNFILISQNYEDHCHVKTLHNLPQDKPILASEKAYHKLKKNFIDREIILLKENKKIDFKGLSFIVFRPKKLFDPIYFAIVIINKKKQAIFYAPHGFSLNKEQLSLIRKYSFDLLITTFTQFKLPIFMGGEVNPGMDNVYKLHQQINSRYTINTHDEKKISKGLVSLLSKISYPNFREIESNNSINFKKINNYKEIKII